VKVDPRALAGIERKVTRADEHFRLLADEMQAWSDRRPWRFPYEVHDNGRKHFFRLQLVEPIPIEWAVILGEAVHDLRSALDQAVYWLTVDWTGQALEDSAFPVCSTRHNFRHWSKKRKDWRGGCDKIRGIGPGPQAFIEALQPYPQRYKGRPACYHLRLLHDLWNKDKHRLVNVWGLRHTDADLRLDQNVIADCSVGLDSRVLQEGAIIVKIIANPPHPEVKVEGEISSTLSLAVGKRKGGGTVTLMGIYSTPADIIRKLTNAIGQQDRPINLTAWSAPPAP
jgi:hypothetical protein